MVGILGLIGGVATTKKLVEEMKEPTLPAGHNKISSMYDGALDVACGKISRSEYNKRIRQGYYK